MWRGISLIKSTNMKKIFTLFLFAIALGSMTFSQNGIMEFTTGPIEPGFTLTGWSGATGGVIYKPVSADSAVLTVNSGTFNFISFQVGNRVTPSDMEVYSDLNDYYSYDASVSNTTHTLNWVGVKEVIFKITVGPSLSSDHDNFVYGASQNCKFPDVPTLITTLDTLCNGASTVIKVSPIDSLHDALKWYLFQDSCGGSALTNNTTGIFSVTPSVNTTYFVRGQDGYGCVDESQVQCGSILIVSDSLTADISQNGSELTATTSNVSYQWLTCGSVKAPILNANAQVYTATTNGKYAVAIDNGICIDTSSCVTVVGIGIEKSFSTKDLKIFPNPANDFIQVELAEVFPNSRIVVRDLMGTIVDEIDVDRNLITIDITLYASGVYFIDLYQENTRLLTNKIIVE